MFKAVYYTNYENSPSNILLNKLISAKERGVDIKVVLELGENLDEIKKANRYTCRILKNNNIDVKLHGKNVTTHAKVLIIDSSTVLIGSTNWNYYSLEKNHEANVLIRSKKIASEFEKYFSMIWEESINC
jgi:cardiolipin synthase